MFRKIIALGLFFAVAVMFWADYGFWAIVIGWLAALAYAFVATISAVMVQR